MSDGCTVEIKDQEQIRWEREHLECNRKCDCTEKCNSKRATKKAFIHSILQKTIHFAQVSQTFAHIKFAFKWNKREFKCELYAVKICEIPLAVLCTVLNFVEKEFIHIGAC